MSLLTHNNLSAPVGPVTVCWFCHCSHVTWTTRCLCLLFLRERERRKVRTKIEPFFLWVCVRREREEKRYEREDYSRLWKRLRDKKEKRTTVFHERKNSYCVPWERMGKILGGERGCEREEKEREKNNVFCQRERTHLRELVDKSLQRVSSKKSGHMHVTSCHPQKPVVLPLIALTQLHLSKSLHISPCM